jgi:hypothetical protein
MKYIISIIILSLFLNTFLFAQKREEVLKILENPKPYLESIQNGINSRDTSLEGDDKLANKIQVLAYCINQEILAVDSKDWLNPTPERIAVIEKWGKILEPYSKELLILALEESKTRERSSRQARSILDFAKPSSEFASEIRKYISVSESRTTGVALTLLYEHRLISEQDKGVMRQLMALTRNDKEKVRYAQNLYAHHRITDWEDFLIEKAKLDLKARPENDDPESIAEFYKSALATARILKTNAQPLLPLLNELIEYINVKIPSHLPRVESARDAVLGLAPDDVAYAKNGSGPLSIKIGSTHQPKIQEGQSRSKSESTIPNQDTKKSESFSWLWIGAILLFVVIFGVYLIIRRRKSM